MPEVRGQLRPLVLVTGVGRAVGIGAAVVRRLALDGWDVAFTFHSPYDERVFGARDDAGRAALLDQVRDHGGRAAALPADLGHSPDVPDLFDRITGEWGRSPTALVMCHCESIDSGLLDTTIDSFDRHYAVNVRGSWLVLREFALRFPAGSGPGRIVAMTSDHTVGNVPYGATKGALDRLVLAAARELAHLPVTSNVINPGPTDTGWMSEELQQQVTAAMPLGRLGAAADAANLVGFLCSEQGGWVNGQLLHSDGGLDS